MKYVDHSRVSILYLNHLKYRDVYIKTAEPRRQNDEKNEITAGTN
jgi:hypothetical protein